MNKPEVFKNAELGSVRVVMVEEVPYFVGKDVAEILGYKDTSDAIKRHVDDEDKLTRRFTDSVKAVKCTSLMNLSLQPYSFEQASVC